MTSNNGTGPPQDFVSLFVEFYREYESPTSFWKWAAYSVVGSLLRDNVFFQHGNFKIYPNTYIVFLAESAQYRKGAPIEAARRLLELVHHTKVFSGTASIQAILDLLSQTSVNKMTGVPIKGGSALITADELAAFFVSDPRLIPLLTDIWSPREKYHYNLRSSNSITVDNLCPSLLAASNDTFLREVYDSRAVYGGLLGRTFMIKPDETRPANSLMEETKVYDEKPLVNALHKIRQLSGRIKINSDAILDYNEWYRNLYATYRTHPDRTGVIQRMHTNVIKLAIIQAAANYSLEVTKETLRNAIEDVASLRQNYELYVMSAGASDQAVIGTKFIAAMFERKDYTIARKTFLANHWSDVTSEDFDKLIATLIEGGMISPTIVGVETGYKLTEKALSIMKKEQK